MPDVLAFLLANVKTGKEYEVVEMVKKIPGVKEVILTYGLWDMIVRIEAPSMSELDRIVTSIRNLEGIEQTATLLGV